MYKPEGGFVMNDAGSKEITAAAVRLAITADRNEEQAVKELLSQQNIKSAAIDYGGDFSGAVAKILGRAGGAAKRTRPGPGQAGNGAGHAAAAGTDQEHPAQGGCVQPLQPQPVCADAFGAAGGGYRRGGRAAA